MNTAGSPRKVLLGTVVNLSPVTKLSHLGVKFNLLLVHISLSFHYKYASLRTMPPSSADVVQRALWLCAEHNHLLYAKNKERDSKSDRALLALHHPREMRASK